MLHALVPNPTLNNGGAAQSQPPAKAPQMQFSIGGPSGDMADAGVRAFCEVVTREHPFQHRHGSKWSIVSDEVVKAISKSTDTRTMKKPSAEKMKEMLTRTMEDEEKYRKAVMFFTDETGNPARALAANGLSQLTLLARGTLYDNWAHYNASKQSAQEKAEKEKEESKKSNEAAQELLNKAMSAAVVYKAHAKAAGDIKTGGEKDADFMSSRGGGHGSGGGAKRKSRETAARRWCTPDGAPSSKALISL